jgi:hypothetical protein
MISHAKISRHRRMFKTLTGLSTEGFKQMLPSFEKVWKDTGFQDYEPAGARPCKQRRNPRGANSAPKRRRPIGLSPRKNSAPAHALICDKV